MGVSAHKLSLALALGLGLGLDLGSSTGVGTIGEASPPLAAATTVLQPKKEI